MMSNMREMTINDYEQIISLWQSIDGLVLSEADSKQNIDLYLKRNPGLCYVCEHDNKIVGTILCGHDGRRAFIYHLAVHSDYRNKQLGQRMVQVSLSKLAEQGIEKCHLFVLGDNLNGQAFWSKIGWQKRSGFFVYSKDV